MCSISCRVLATFAQENVYCQIVYTIPLCARLHYHGENMFAIRHISLRTAQWLSKVEWLFLQVCHQPKVYVYDTPGIMPPKINNIEVGLKLALCCKYNSLWLFDLIF